MKTKLLTAIMITTTALFFSGCGGGGGGSDAHFKNGDNIISIVDCQTPANLDAYTPMLSGDVLVNETANTKVTTYHDINGTKKVCTVTGVAHLIR